MPSIRPLASILIVDDTPVNFGVIADGLENLGYEVLVAQDGEEALQRAVLTAPDLILLDIMLPGLDGFEVCRRLKAQARTRDIPVIFMSALDGVQDKVTGFRVGAVDFVTKPVQIDEVQARIGLHLNLRALQRQLETQNTRLQSEIAERQRMEASLDHERATLRAFFRTLPELVWMKDLDGRYVLCNPLFASFVGLQEAKVIGKTDFDFVDASQAASFRATDRRAQEAGNYKVNEEWIRDASNGRDVLFEITKRAVRDAQGRMIGVLGIARDITERRRTEYALAASEVKYRSVFESASDGIFLHRIVEQRARSEFVLHDANHKGCELFGASREEMLSGQFSILDTARPPFSFAAAIQYYRLAAIGHPQQFDWELVRGDGSVIWGEVNVRRIDVGGEGFLLAIVRDVSGRVRLENALAAQAAEYLAVLGNSPDIIARYDTSCRLRYANPAFEALHSQQSGRLLGKSPVGTWVTPDNLAQAQDFQARLQHVLNTGEAMVWEFTLKTDAAQRIDYQTRGVPELDAEGQVVGVLSIMRDITELKAREAELEASRMQLRELSEHRDAVLEEERKRIARELHEELGQVLTALRLMISMLRVEYGVTLPALNERSHGMTELVDRAIRSMREVVTTLRPSALDAGIMAALEWLVQDVRKHTGLECRLEVSEPIALSRDRSLGVFRIAQEVLTNAVRHARALHVDVHIARIDAHWKIRIQDNGVGFDPNAPRSAKSFGLLGLRERAHALEGELTIVSAPGQGTQVCIVFPVLDSDTAQGV